MRTTNAQQALGVEPLPLALSVKQAAVLLGVSPQTMYRALEAGQYPSIRVGKSLRVPTRMLLERLGCVESP